MHIVSFRDYAYRFFSGTSVHTHVLFFFSEYTFLGRGYCNNWVYLTEGGYPNRLATTESLYSPNPVLECMKRCKAQVGQTGITSSIPAQIATRAFYLKGEKCACSSDSCSSITSDSGYTAYKIIKSNHLYYIDFLMLE
jgi:hypothetical protein